VSCELPGYSLYIIYLCILCIFQYSIKCIYTKTQGFNKRCHTVSGTELVAAARRRLPPKVTLGCDPVAWLPDGTADLVITLERAPPPESEEGRGASSSRSPVRLLVGSLHDNALLACRSLCLESFPSPLRVRVQTKEPAGGAQLEVVVSLVHERLIGQDVSSPFLVSFCAHNVDTRSTFFAPCEVLGSHFYFIFAVGDQNGGGPRRGLGRYEVPCGPH
jgi:hypothetical protein